MFGSIPDTQLRLEKQDGTIKKNIPAKITKEMIVVFNQYVPIETGDILVRVLPSKVEEKFEIIDFTFYEKVLSIPAHFQIEYKRYVEKKNQDKQMKNTSHKTYNIHSSNVIIESQNSSINTTSNDKELFEEMLKVINASTIDNKIEIVKAINNMKENSDTPLFNDKYKEFISISANVMTIVSPYIPALTSMLK